MQSTLSISPCVSIPTTLCILLCCAVHPMWTHISYVGSSIVDREGFWQVGGINRKYQLPLLFFNCNMKDMTLQIVSDMNDKTCAYLDLPQASSAQHDSKLPPSRMNPPDTEELRRKRGEADAFLSSFHLVFSYSLCDHLFGLKSRAYIDTYTTYSDTYISISSVDHGRVTAVGCRS